MSDDGLYGPGRDNYGRDTPEKIVARAEKALSDAPLGSREWLKRLDPIELDAWFDSHEATECSSCGECGTCFKCDCDAVMSNKKAGALALARGVAAACSCRGEGMMYLGHPIERPCSSAVCAEARAAIKRLEGDNA